MAATRKPKGPSANEKRLAFRAREVAELLGVNTWSVYELIKDGRLRTTRLAGGTLLISRKAIDEYLDGAA